MKKNPPRQSHREAGLQPQVQLAHEPEVSRRAYEIWQESGCQHGADTAHWLQAEREVQARRQAPASRLADPK